MLLDLARDLIARARRDENCPLPVVFNLSTWGADQPPLEEWLVAELRSRYNVGPAVARPWVAQGEMCLLLDGLDEVAPDRQAACVQALNAYRQGRPL